MKKKYFKLICAGALASMLFFAGCEKESESQPIVNKNALSLEESINYMEEKFEVPFERTSFELDHVTEDSIGLLTDPDGAVEWYTITRSVKKEYRDKAEDYISQEKTLEKEWLEYRIWKFTFDDEKQWNREEVEKDRGLADESIQFTGAKAFYGADNCLYVVLQYENEVDDGKTKYTLGIFGLNDATWSKVMDVSYEDGEDGFSYPVSYYVNSANNFLIAQSDGAIRGYSMATGEENDISTDFKFDVSNVVFQDGMGYSLDDDNNQVVVFDDETLVEEDTIPLPERLSGGGSKLVTGRDDTLIIFNKAGIYVSGLQEEEFTKVSSSDIFNSVSIDHLFIREMTAVSKEEFYVSMYETDMENQELKFSRCKGVNVDDKE